jgi:hypothetical protein
MCTRASVAVTSGGDPVPLKIMGASTCTCTGPVDCGGSVAEALAAAATAGSFRIAVATAAFCSGVAGSCGTATTCVATAGDEAGWIAILGVGEANGAVCACEVCVSAAGGGGITGEGAASARCTGEGGGHPQFIAAFTSGSFTCPA